MTSINYYSAGGPNRDIVHGIGYILLVAAREVVTMFALVLVACGVFVTSVPQAAAIPVIPQPPGVHVPPQRAAAVTTAEVLPAAAAPLVVDIYGGYESHYACI